MADQTGSPATEYADNNTPGAPGNGPSEDATNSRIKQALTEAHRFYTEMAPKSWVPRYLSSRGLDPAVSGYAPGRSSLVNHLREQGFTDNDMLAAGLARTSERGLYDVFRNRLTLPYTDPDGQVVGFITRKPPADTNDRNPKYLNSPTTDVFHKTHLPFGLDRDTVNALKAGADIVIVEGPMDALAINTATRQHGLVAVATGGTALTPAHLATLDRIAPLADRQVIVLMDNDPAGDAAAVKARKTLATAGVDEAVTLVPLPVKDASQLLQEQGPEALRDALADRRPLEDLVIDHIINQWPNPNHWVEPRINALREAAPMIAAMSADQQYRQTLRLAHQLDLSPAIVAGKVGKDRLAPSVGSTNTFDPDVLTPPSLGSKRHPLNPPEPNYHDHRCIEGRPNPTETPSLPTHIQDDEYRLTTNYFGEIDVGTNASSQAIFDLER